MTGVSVEDMLTKSQRLSLGLLALIAVLVPPLAIAAEVGFTGMQVQGITPELAQALGLKKAEGILVRDVALGGLADKPRMTSTGHWSR